ncbi:pilus assembly protein PilM [Desulfurispira natronophila]|uniref:Tfp pilus assembly PilM family ATPase n=1 Tax=Desulfurispira natronophila TaxID=682562 RepID=A0A7W7Y601_9BACT|nr:pilus assembly protein PilM [Desulfurispira natronophila]MBB5022684.1 Tfp pilus assembly PilM family ATPase [Desulfurispira natronophila]
MNIVSIDIGSYSIKCAAATIKGRDCTLTFLGEQELEPGAFRGGDFANQDAIFASLRELLSNVTLTGSHVVLSVPHCSLLHKTTVEYPGASLTEAMKMIHWDYIQYLPESDDSTGVTVAFSGRRHPSEKDTSCVDIVTIPEYLAASYINLFRDISVDIDEIDLSTFAIEHFYQMVAPSMGEGLIINVGHEYTEFGIIFDETPDCEGYLEIGVSDVIQNVAESMDIPFGDAVGVIKGDFLQDASGDMQEMVDEEFIKLAERICRNILKICRERYNNPRMEFEHCVLAGGASDNLAFNNRVIDRLQTQVVHTTSVPKVHMGPKVEGLAEKGLGKYALAIGLCLRQ